MTRIEAAKRMGAMNKGRKSFRKGMTLEQEYGIDKANGIREVMRRSRTGKTYEDIFGDKAILMRQIKQIQGINNNPFKGKHHTEEVRNINRQAHLGHDTSLETRKILGLKSKNNWLNPNFGCNKEGYWQKQRISKHTKPNGLERFAQETLNNAFGIGVWEFVGDFKLIIRNNNFTKRRCPDFKHLRLNKLIEVFNVYDKMKNP